MKKVSANLKPGFDPEWLDYVDEVLHYVNSGQFDPYFHGMRDIAVAMTDRVNAIATAHPQLVDPIVASEVKPLFDRSNVQVGHRYQLKQSRGGRAWWSGATVFAIRHNGNVTFSARVVGGPKDGMRCKVHYSSIEKEVKA